MNAGQPKVDADYANVHFTFRLNSLGTILAGKGL